MAKPSINRVDWHQAVIESLSGGPKKPADIEKDLQQKAIQKYEEQERYDLAEEVKSKMIKRKTIRLRYIQNILYDLLDRGTVAQEKPYGKYFLTDKIFENPKFTASTFSKNAISKITDVDALTENPFVKVDENNIANGYIQEYSLFAFANKIGAFIVYSMLEAMNPDNMKHLVKGIDKEQFVRDKIDKVIDPQRILREFCRIELVKRGLAVWNALPINKSLPPKVRRELLARQRKVKQFEPHNPAWSQYEMDHDSSEKGLQGFRRVYPSIFRELEKTKNDLPSTIRWYRKSFVRSAKKNRATRKQ